MKKDLDFMVPDLGEAVEKEAPQEQPDVLDQLLHGEEDAGQELSDEDLGSLEEEFDAVARLTKERDRLEAHLAEVKRDLAGQKDRMLRAMKAQGTRQFRSGSGVGQCYVQDNYSTAVEDPEAFMEWVRENHPEMLSVHSQTRTSFIRKEYRDKGVAVDSDTFPPGIAVKEYESLQVRDVKPKKERKA